MSTILDALRKAEAEAKRGKQATRATQEMLDVGPLPPAAPSGRGWGPWLGGVAVVATASVAGVGGWWFAHRSPGVSERAASEAPQTAMAPGAVPSHPAHGHGEASDSGKQQAAGLPVVAPPTAPAPPPPRVPAQNPVSAQAAPAAPIGRPLEAESIPPTTGAPAEVAPVPAVVVPAAREPGTLPQAAAVVDAPSMPRAVAAPLPSDASGAASTETPTTGAEPAALPPRRRVDLPRLERRDPEEAARARQARAERQRSIRAEIVAARQSRQDLREAMEDARADSAPPHPAGLSAQGAAGGHAVNEPERSRLPAEVGSDIPPNAVRRVPAGAPEVKLSIVQWSATPSRRFAFVTIPGGTMAQVREGEEVNGLTVNRIYQGAVEFSHAGQTFVLRAN